MASSDSFLAILYRYIFNTYNILPINDILFLKIWNMPFFGNIFAYNGMHIYLWLYSSQEVEKCALHTIYMYGSIHNYLKNVQINVFGRLSWSALFWILKTHCTLGAATRPNCHIWYGTHMYCSFPLLLTMQNIWVGIMGWK